MRVLSQSSKSNFSSPSRDSN